MNKRQCSVIIVLIAVLFCACGYRFEGQSGFPGGGHLLFVNVLENRTQETGVENIVTAALLSELTLRKTAGLTSGIDHADVFLSGMVEKVAIRTISTRRQDTAGERRVKVTINLNLIQQDGSVVWAAAEFTDEEGYIVAAIEERTDQNRRDAIRVLSLRIAEKVVNRMSDDF